MTKTNNVHGETRKDVGMGIWGWGDGRTRGAGGGGERLLMGNKIKDF